MCVACIATINRHGTCNRLVSCSFCHHLRTNYQETFARTLTHTHTHVQTHTNHLHFTSIHFNTLWSFARAGIPIHIPRHNVSSIHSVALESVNPWGERCGKSVVYKLWKIFNTTFIVTVYAVDFQMPLHLFSVGALWNSHGGVVNILTAYMVGLSSPLWTEAVNAVRSDDHRDMLLSSVERCDNYCYLCFCAVRLWWCVLFCGALQREREKTRKSYRNNKIYDRIRSDQWWFHCYFG